MTVNELCKRHHANWGIEGWGESCIDDLLADLPARHKWNEKPYSQVPKALAGRCLFDKIVWLVDICEPPFSLEEIEDYFLECMEP